MKELLQKFTVYVLQYTCVNYCTQLYFAYIQPNIRRCRNIQNVFLFCLWQIQNRKHPTVMLWKRVCLPLEGGILKVNRVAPHQELFMHQVQLIKVLQFKQLTLLALLKTFPCISYNAAFILNPTKHKHLARCNIFLCRDFVLN